MATHDPFYPVTPDGIKVTKTLNRIWQVVEFLALAWILGTFAFHVYPDPNSILGVNFYYIHPRWYFWPILFWGFPIACNICSIVLRRICRWTIVFIYGSEDTGIIEDAYESRLEKRELKKSRKSTYKKNR